VLRISQAIFGEKYKALRRGCPRKPGSGIVCVLKELLENGEASAVAVTQVLADALDVCKWRVAEAGHNFWASIKATKVRL
jgi:hypothetical protein